MNPQTATKATRGLDVLGSVGFDYGAFLRAVPGVLQTAGGALSGDSFTKPGAKDDGAALRAQQEIAALNQQLRNSERNQWIYGAIGIALGFLVGRVL